MLSLRNTDKIYLYRHPTDMRKGFDGLSGLVANELRQDVLQGDIFVFLNRSRDKLKLLRYEQGGFVLFYKRLEKGRFELPGFSADSKVLTLNSAKLTMLLEGVSLAYKKVRKRY